MKLRFLFLLGLLSTMPTLAQADEPIFSGPQIGEPLPALKLQGVFDEEGGKEIEPTKQAGDSPQLIVFFHQRTRPAFGLTNTLMSYAATRKTDGLHSSVAFLSPDATATKQWLNQVRKHFATGPTYGIASGGLEGPGSYGLNRNVTLTVLIAKEGKVTANFAIVQPNLPVDGQKIVTAISKTLGDEKSPLIADIIAKARPAMARTDAKRPAANQEAMQKMRPLLAPVINKNATPAQVDAAAAKVDEAIAKDATLAKELGRIANTIVNAGKVKNYGTPRAQEKIKAWAKKHAAMNEPRKLEE